MEQTTALEAVVKSVTVKASPARAFEVFTKHHDTWWPRTHHIGKASMTRSTVECLAGGRCYSSHEDGSERDWGRVLVFEPPTRLVLAWMITHEWGYNPDITKASEVEVLFTGLEDGMTRVELTHRNFERMGPGALEMRTAVAGGWLKIMELFAACADGGERG
jgi:uncharacterized protein YndB with AHSA1/START domain